MAMTPGIAEQLASKLADAIRRGELLPGQRLPAMRDLAAERGLDVGTVNRAYQTLAQLGLVESHSRRGTVVREPSPPARFTPDGAAYAIACVCSHDFGLDLLARHLRDAGVSLSLRPDGSSAGLRELAAGHADLAGSHLLDDDGDGYNHDAAARILPGRRLALVTLVEREQGLIVRAGNPLGLRAITDLTRPGVRLANRQPGSGTRVLLDRLLAAEGLPGAAIAGYERELPTHLAVAAAVAGKSADVGLGVAAAAQALGLTFIPLARERYDIVLLEQHQNAPWFGPLIETLAAPRFQSALGALAGYDTTHTAWIRSVVPSPAHP
jgi:putative molybdopterin biosynthesis protein